MKTLYALMLAASQLLSSDPTEKQLAAYVQEQITKQEQAFLITHTNTPTVKIGIPDTYSPYTQILAAAVYNENTQTIYYNKEFLKQEQQHSFSEDGLSLKSVTWHELGHHYVNQQTTQPWPNLHEEMKQREPTHTDYLIKELSEDMADVLAKRNNGLIAKLINKNAAHTITCILNNPPTNQKSISAYYQQLHENRATWCTQQESDETH